MVDDKVSILPKSGNNHLHKVSNLLVWTPNKLIQAHVTHNDIEALFKL